MFQVTEAEHEALRSHFATSNVSPGRGGRRYLPYVFTEHGAIMAATVLNSASAIEMSVYVVRAFVKLREVLSSNHVLSRIAAWAVRSIAPRRLRNYINAAIGFEALSKAVGSPAKSLMRMLGGANNPRAHQLFGVLKHLR